MTTSRPHDRLFHAAFSRVDALREFLPRHLDPDVLAILDLGRLEVVKGSFLDPRLQEHDRYRAEGLAEGVRGQRRMLLETLRLRFAALPTGLEARLGQLSDPALIEGLHRAALTATDLAEFESQLDG